MKKITLFLILTLFATFFAEGQEERLATGIRDARTTQVQNTQSRALTTIYETDHTGATGAEITAAANGPNTSMADAIVLAGTNRILQTVTVDVFNLASAANYDLTLRIYTDCTTNGTTGACGSGPGTLVAGSSVTQNVTPGPLGFIYSVTFTLPNVNLYGEVDNTISVSLNASRNDVYWILNENPVIGSQPAGEPALSVVQRCGSSVANNGCTRNFGIINNFAMTLEAEAIPPNDLCANAITITGDGTISGTTLFATTDTGTPFCGTGITSPGVWYVFTDSSGTGSSVTMDLCGAPFDSKISVYSGSCAGLTCIIGEDDDFTNCGGNDPYVTFSTDGSSTYYVLVHGFGGGSGPFDLHVSGFPIVIIGNAPVIACPSDIVVNNAPGTCGAVANFAGVAFDVEDGNISGDIIATPPSGSVFPVGDTTVTLSVTDSDGNTSTCSFTVTVNDNEPPVAVCQDLTLDLDPVTGTVSITGADVDNGSTDNCGIASMTLDISSFDCSNTGANTVTMTVTDNSGNSSTCTSTVTVQDVTAPEVFCIGGFGQFTESEDFEAGLPADWSTVVNTGNCDWINSGDMPTGDDFPTLAMLFDDDDCGLGAPASNVSLVSAVYDLTGASNVFVGYDVAFQESGTQTFEVEVWDGAAWQQIALYEDDLDPDIQTESFDVSAFANAAFQVRWTFDDNNGEWGWGAGVDNFLLTYEATSGGGLDVFLDANGMASVDPNDLVTGVNEACGYTITAGGAGGGTMENLTTTFAGGNGNFGNMFDVNAITDVTIDSFDINADTGATFDVEVYAKTGTWVGFEADPGAWTLIGTAVGVVSNGDGVATPLNLALDYVMAAGETHAFYVTPTDFSTGGLNYTNGTGTGNVFASDANIEFLEGAARGYPFSGSTFQPRVFNGNILYTTGGGSGLDFTCADLGENLVEVTVTDNSGNSSTCTAVVNVIDITAPVITCGPEPTISATVSDSPALAIVDNTTVSTTIEVTDEFDITDLNVDLNITHTWVGDLRITLQSPSGTQVLIFDGAADGCSGDNIIDLYDDESSNALSCMAGTPDAFPLADYRPSNPLSAFDGQSTVGTWTISIEDAAAGDTGTLNTWGLTYSYANTNTDVVIELGPDGTATIDPYDIINNVVEACGIDTAAVDVPTVSCADIGSPILVTVFVTDASGNLASCSANVIVVDLLAPELTCPADQTVDPGAGNLFYIVPDYFATGEATADDNCTDPVTDTTQDPAPGSTLTDGVYTITMTATDEYGNTSTCDFELTVESTLGVNQNSLDAGIALYPNPASNVVNLVNKTNISLEKMMIFDINGKLVNQTDLRTMQGEKAVDVSSLAAGVYVVQIIGDNASTVKRLIKE